MGNNSGSSINYDTIESVVTTYLQRRPQAEFLKDDLLSEAYLMVAEGKATSESAVHSRLREYLYEEIHHHTRSPKKRKAPMTQSTVDMTSLSAEHEQWRDWYDCCRDSEEWDIMLLTLSGRTAAEVAGILEMTEVSVNYAINAVSERYVDNEDSA